MEMDVPTKESVLFGKSAASEPGFKEESESLLIDSSTVVIESENFLSSLNFRSLWEYRELFYFLALRDIKIRYKQTLLGVVWVILQPVITTLIFTTIFLRLGAAQNLDVPYPLYAFSGFTLWVFISAAISNSSNSLINHSGLITKVYFPRLIIPISAVGATLVDLAIGLGSLGVAMTVYQVPITWKILYLPILLVPMFFLTLGMGIILASLNVRYRDVKYILPVGLQLLLFSSPVFYSLGMLSEGSVWMWQFNPLTGILENFRFILFGQDLDWFSLSVSFLASIFVFFLAIYVFHSMEDDFADVI